MNFKVAKSYSENILKIEIINLVKSYMNITGIQYEEGMIFSLCCIHKFLH